MSTIALELILLLALIILNGLFAMSEMAVVSARKARLQEQANKGNPGARTALELANQPNSFLSTVQIGITLIGVLAGAFGGATLAEALGEQFNRVAWIAPHGETLGLGLVVLLITYLSLVIGELVPKRLALQKPERVAMLVARPMHRLSHLTYPLVRFLSLSTNLVVRLLGVRPSEEPPVAEEEIRLMMLQGTEAGVFEQAEQDMVERVFRLDNRRATTLMPPHTELIWLDVDDSPADLLRKAVNTPHSAVLVCDGGLDQIRGIVNTKDVLAGYASGQQMDLNTLLHKPYFIPESATAADILDVFKQHYENLIVVIDEHGGVQGVITKHDMLEALVGDFPFSVADHQPQAVQREDQSWLLDGLMPIDDFRDLFDLGVLPGEERGSFQTLGGFVMHQLGKIPSAGEHFHWNGYRFEIVDMDGRRVDKVLVEAEPQPVNSSS